MLFNFYSLFAIAPAVIMSLLFSQRRCPNALSEISLLRFQKLILCK